MSQAGLTQDQVFAATSVVLERALDDELNKLDDILNDETELEKLRKNRLAEMKAEQEKKSQWKKLGHGVLQESNDPKDFFRACEVSPLLKKLDLDLLTKFVVCVCVRVCVLSWQESERVVVVFVTPANEHSVKLSEHLALVASKHPETRFLKMDAEKTPFLVDRLRIWMIPSVALVKNEKVVHTLLGLDEMTTSMGKYDTWSVEKCLFCHEMVTSQVIEEQMARDLLDNRADLF
jgi:hypothetical protein